MKRARALLAAALGLTSLVAPGSDLEIQSDAERVSLAVHWFRGTRGLLLASPDLDTWTPVHAFQVTSYAGASMALPSDSTARFFRVEQDTTPLPTDLVWIPAGTFLMGSPVEELDRQKDEGPVHEVRIGLGFWMGRTEVTVREFESLMTYNPSMSPSGSLCPVERVSWGASMEFCRRRTERDRAAGVIPAGTAYRLPSEAEWEYACRAGTRTRYSYGDDHSYRELDFQGWYAGNAMARTHDVAQKYPNPWGLYDMHGNVFEWCLDFYGCYPGGTRGTPAKVPVYRGGSWYCPPEYLRSSSRHPGGTAEGAYFIGFRVVLGAPADTVRVSPDLEPPVPQLTWAADGTSVTVQALPTTPGSQIGYSQNVNLPTIVWSKPPLVLTRPGTVKAAAFLECCHRSSGIDLVVEQVPVPVVRVIDGQLSWTPQPAEAWLDVYPGQGTWIPSDQLPRLAEHGSVRVRARHPRMLTSEEATVAW